MSRSLFPSSLVQPLIVSLLPLFLLIWNLDTDWKKAVVHQQEVFREMTNRLQVRVRRLTSPEFWPEHWTRRLSTRLAQTIEQHSSTEHIEKLVQTWKTQVASGAMVWVATCASDSDRASLLLEGGTGYRKVWSDLFHFLFACFKNPIELALSREQHNLIRGLFGDHFPVSLLAPEMRGRPFPVLFRGSSFWLCWELLFAEPGPASGSRKRRLLGGVIVMFPQQQLQYRQVMELVLRRWRAMVPEAKGVECAFLPLPVKPGPLMEPPMGDIRWLQGVVKQRMVSFLRQLELKGSTNGWIAGDPVLPGSAINDILDLETHWGRVLPAAPILGHAVMLCGPKRAVTEPMRAILARWVFAFWLIGWLVVFVFRWWFGRFPDPGIRLGMQLWFLGLLAVPLILMVLTANNWLLDYRSNLLLAKRQEMEQVIAQIEAGTRVLNEEQTQLLNRLSTSPDLGRQLKEVEEGRLASAVFMDHFLESVLQSGLDPGAIFFYGHGGFEVSIMRRAHIVDQEIEMRRFVSTLAEGLLQHADPELAREYRLREERRNVAGAKKANPFQGLSSNPMTYLQIGSTEEFRMGRVSMMKFHSSIRWQGRVHYCLFVFWSFDRACRVFLKSQIPKMNIAYRDLGIAAYRELQDGVEVIFEPRVDESMQRWAELAREQPVFREQDGMLVLAVQSRTLPGYLLVVRGSLDGILQAVQTERFRLLMAALLLAFMVALSGYGLSTWLSDPILQMTLAIQKIAGGNLDIRVTEPRPDELGSAGESIDQMTRQLQERRRMSRFVAP
ncbi:MAG TPA: HAMP domain-containing protein, partial [Candidatus Ozemobacteraceae bacterium]|nr:HAMP domain-containing protein [Candidatus Ozemobacteraceae bacterium]